MWTCWLFRNAIVFRGLKADGSQVFDLCIQRLSCWCNVKWPDSGILINGLINCPYHFADVMVKQVITPNIAWCPTADGELKFNFDGATTGSYGQAGIGGCLRDVLSKCLLTFSKYVGIVDCTSAEILAFRKLFSCRLVDESPTVPHHLQTFNRLLRGGVQSRDLELVMVTANCVSAV
ncbi:hypothetical protein V6N12_007379 [Hibiscus sabdariffa]|uniref:RNase H type-1 domain-containing protein n=1 Tax=Hibiscus sabdariffa TaxID=183260 RepID=A0ABR2F1K0_9ROSI